MTAPTADTLAAEGAADPPGGRTALPRRLGEPGDIDALLRELLARRALLGVSRLEAPREVHSSLLLELLPEHTGLLIDAFAPAAGTPGLAPGEALRVEARLPGGSLRFDTEVTAREQREGLDCYRLAPPAELHYAQRRRHLRVSIPAGQVLEVRLLTPRGVRLSGEARDLSVTGLSLRLPRGVDGGLRVGDVLPRCSVRLPDGLPLVCGLEICYASPGDGLLGQRLGARFLDLDATGVGRLEALVLALAGAPG